MPNTFSDLPLARAHNALTVSISLTPGASVSEGARPSIDKSQRISGACCFTSSIIRSTQKSSK